MDAGPVEPTKNRVKNERAARSSGPKSLREAEAPGGFEPPHRGFADLCLTTWLRRRMLWVNNLAQKSGRSQGHRGRICGTTPQHLRGAPGPPQLRSPTVRLLPGTGASRDIFASECTTPGTWPGSRSNFRAQRSAANATGEAVPFHSPDTSALSPRSRRALPVSVRPAPACR